MNYKRGRCKRVVRCKLCTPHRWRGNNVERFRAKETHRKRDDLREVGEELCEHQGVLQERFS